LIQRRRQTTQIVKNEVLFEVRVDVKETQVAIKLPEGIAPLSQCRNKRSILPWQISLHFIAKKNPSDQHKLNVESVSMDTYIYPPVSFQCKLIDT